MHTPAAAEPRETQTSYPKKALFIDNTVPIFAQGRSVLGSLPCYTEPKPYRDFRAGTQPEPTFPAQNRQRECLRGWGGTSVYLMGDARGLELGLRVPVPWEPELGMGDLVDERLRDIAPGGCRIQEIWDLGMWDLEDAGFQISRIWSGGPLSRPSCSSKADPVPPYAWKKLSEGNSSSVEWPCETRCTL